MDQHLSLRIVPTSYTVSTEGTETVLEVTITLDELEAITTQVEALAADTTTPAETMAGSTIDDLLLPFCACGRRWSQCDGARAQCHQRRDPQPLTAG